MFDGIEVDVLSLGDADAIVVTKWNSGFPHRVLIDGGSASDADKVSDFLWKRGYTSLWAVVCTHLHCDHTQGLIRLLQTAPWLTIHNAWMHDIRKHLSADELRRASAADDGVKQVVESTKELCSAFAGRGLTPSEPFTGSTIAAYPAMTVLGPSSYFYKRTLQDFTNVGPAVAFRSLAAAFARPVASPLIGTSSPLPSLLSTLTLPVAPSPLRVPLPPLSGALSRSSVQKNPKTQPYNNTSVILGVNFNGRGLMLTGDAGCDALRQVGAEWNRLLYLGVPHHGSDGNLSQTDIERFCPEFAFISCCGDSSHPDRAIVSGLNKVGAKVYSTHKSGNLWFYAGSVPARSDYGYIEPLTGAGQPEAVGDWFSLALRLSSKR